MRGWWLVAALAAAGCGASEKKTSGSASVAADRAGEGARTGGDAEEARHEPPAPDEPAKPPGEDGGAAKGEAFGLPDVIATIDGENVTREEFLRRAIEWWGPETMEQIVLRRVLEREVKKSGVSVGEDELEKRVDWEMAAREGEVKQKYGMTLEKYLAAHGRTVADLRKSMLANEDLKRQMLLESMIAYAYATEPRVLVRHIQVRDKAKAEDLRQRLRDGEKFEKLAEQETDDEFGAQRGGLMRAAFIRGMSTLGDAFEDAAFALQQKGDVSPVVKTERGYHILRLEERVPASPRTFDSMRKDLKKPKMERETLDQWMTRLRRDHAKDVRYLVPELAPGK